MRRVVITGMGVVSALGNSPETVERNVCEGALAIRRQAVGAAGDSREFICGPVVEFDENHYFGNVNIRPFNRTARLLIAATRSALESSGCAREHAEIDIALVVGTMYCSMRTISEFDRRGLTAGPAYVSPMDFANTVINAAAGQTAIWHKTLGPNVTITGGAASGLQALIYAADLIRNGTAELVLACGVDELCFESLFTFERAGLLSRERGPAPFDSNRDGTALSEAAAVLMLEEYSGAVARGASIYGEIAGSGMAFDCSRRGDARRAIDAVSRGITEALEQAATRPGDIGCVSAAAGGFVDADLQEAHGILSALNGSAATVPVTAIKSVSGDSLGAAGPLAVLSILGSLRDGTIPGIRGLRTLDDDCPLRNLSAETRKSDIRVGLVNALSLDGHCCSMILKRAEAAR